MSKKREGSKSPKAQMPEGGKLSPAMQASHDVQMAMRLDRMFEDGTIEALRKAFDNGALDRIREEMGAELANPEPDEE